MGKIAVDAEVLSGDWAIFSRVLILAAVLCLIAVILLAVPAFFDYLRRWWENVRLSSVIQTKPRETTPAAEQLANQQKIAKPDALGWSAEEDADKRANLQKQSGEVLGPVKSVLIADDDPVVVAALAQRFQHLGFQVLRSPDAAHALMGAMKTSPDLIVLDVNMPSGNGLAVCEMMASDPKYAKIPVIIHSMIADEAIKERCRRLGAHHVEKSPHSWNEIKTLVESLMGRRPAPEPQPETAEQPRPTAEEETPPARQERSGGAASAPILPRLGYPRVLCIETPKDRLEYIERQLSSLGIEVTRTSDLEEGFWTCFTEKPHAVVIQAAKSGETLLKLLKRLAEHPVTRTLPVLLIEEDNAVVQNQLPAGAKFKILRHPVDWEELLGDLAALLPAFGSGEGGLLESLANASPQPGQVESPITRDGNQSPGTDDEHKPLTVLCIDDDPVVARSIATRLQPYGIKVKSADNGTQGYLMASSERPDLILLDLKMPNGQGQYVLSKLKENERTIDIPVIILTVETHPGIRRQMLSVGAEAFLSKPIGWHDLFEEMSRCVALPDQLLADYHLTPRLTLSQL